MLTAGHGKYQLVPAKDHAEAIRKSPFFVGQKAEVISVHATANSDGTYSVEPEFKLVETKPTNA